MDIKKIISTEIIDGVKIITFDDGSQNFTTLDENIKDIKQKSSSLWQKIKNWWNNVNIKPYAKICNLSDTNNKLKEDPTYDGSGSKTAAEIGIKITF